MGQQDAVVQVGPLWNGLVEPDPPGHLAGQRRATVVEHGDGRAQQPPQHGDDLLGRPQPVPEGAVGGQQQVRPVEFGGREQQPRFDEQVQRRRTGGQQRHGEAVGEQP